MEDNKDLIVDDVETGTTSTNYDDTSIGQLLGANRIRKRPASMLGSSGLAGARHGFTEIYGNALDEASSGYGDKLDVVFYADNSISVRDYGRGVPMGWNDKQGTWNWHIIFNDLYGGGKYETNQDVLRSIVDWSSFNAQDFNYLYSVGLNGLGAASTQYTSEFFIVRSIRDGVCTEMQFEKGLPIFNGEPVDMFKGTITDLSAYAPKTYKTDEPDGTFIKWKPDQNVFSGINPESNPDGVGGDWLYNTCKDIAYVAGITLHFINEKKDIDIIIPAGNLSTMIMDNYKGKLFVDEDENPIVYSAKDFGHGDTIVEGKPFIWVCEADVSIGLSGTSLMSHSCYHNSVKMSGGVQYEAIFSAIREFFSTKAVSYKIKLDERDYSDIFIVSVSTYSNYASFRNQTKDAVDDDFIRNLVRSCVLNKLNMEYSKGDEYIKDAVNRVIEAAQHRIAVTEASKQIREAKKAVKPNTLPDKFITCHSFIKKEYEISELWIVEGDSACGAIKQARDSSFQAIFPIRGKCLNVLKATLDKIIKNDVISAIFTLLGTGMDLNIDIEEELFDITRLRFGKIIFATDADEDGFQIRVLLFLIFYRLAPQLLEQGRIFIAETPRFEIRLSDGTAKYARDDAQRDEYLQQYSGTVTAVNRFKGLGEVDAPVLRETTVHPDTRNLVPLTLDFSDETTQAIIEALFGADKFRQRKSILTSVLGEDMAELLEQNELLLAELDKSDIDEGIDYIQVS